MLRVGPKGILCGLDIAFVNGWAMWRAEQPASTARKTLDRKFTKVRFGLG